MNPLTENQVLSILQRALNVKEGVVKSDTKSSDLAEWDSLGQLSILSALDKGFDGKIAGKSGFATAISVPEILELLRKYSLIN
jgi:acyl carrier protein